MLGFRQDAEIRTGPGCYVAALQCPTGRGIVQIDYEVEVAADPNECKLSVHNNKM